MSIATPTPQVRLCGTRTGTTHGRKFFALPQSAFSLENIGFVLPKIDNGITLDLIDG
jgi:hypothetical protein